LAAADGSGLTPLDHALGDGEDFELILAVPPEAAERLLADQPLAVPLARIGSFIAEPGLWTADPAGGRRPLPPRGYQH
jgi:thiamine-monophosphate kinase